MQKAIRTISLVAFATATAAAAKNWENWNGPSNLESLAGSSSALNTPAVDGCASHSPDGLKIVFNSNRAGTQDLYIATRTSTSEGFGSPQPLPAPINSGTADEFCPTITGDSLYFSSTRNGDIGDLYVSKLGPRGWGTPRPLGNRINTRLMEESVTIYEDDNGRPVLLFSRRQANGTGGDIYQSADGRPATLVPGGPHSSASDNRPSVTQDGLTIFFDSTRFGTLGGPDIWYATRSNTSEPFGQAIHLGTLSSAGFDARPYISGDETFLTFSSSRSGNESPASDMWFATRN